MNPPPLMKLVEIVRAVQTSDETYDLTVPLAEKMGKTITTSRDAPGFLVNRILIPMLVRGVLRAAGGRRHAGGHRHGREARPQPPDGPARAD